MKNKSDTENNIVRIGRRKFLKLGALGGGASLLSLALPDGKTRAAADIEALLLKTTEIL